MGLRKRPVICVYEIPWYTALGLCGVPVVYPDGVLACGFLWIPSFGFVVSAARRWQWWRYVGRMWLILEVTGVLRIIRECDGLF